MSPNNHIDPAALQEISQLCDVATDQIEDVYACTPFQLSIAAHSGGRDDVYVQRFVFSLSANLDLARLCEAVGGVVALNQVLRTRLVDSQHLGLVQVVLREDPSTRTLWIDGGLDRYLASDRVRPMGLGSPMFRSALIQGARKWVLTIHHCIFDQFSSLALLDDVTRICRGLAPIFHAPFKQFVDYCGSIRESDAKKFWAGQFTGTPSIFPSVSTNISIDATGHMSRQIRPPANLASPALLPVYLECAWALLAHAYGGGDSVAYGVIYSGRNASTAWKGMDSTLGPTIATLPTEVAISPDITVGELLKRRQVGRQALQSCGPAMQMGLSSIRKISQSAKQASGFQTVLNFIHNAPPSQDCSPIYFDYEDDVHRAYAIGLTFLIGSNVDVALQGRTGGLEVLADFDQSLVSLATMERLLAQLDHVLQTLGRAPAETRIGDLAMLGPRDRLDTLKWNNAMAEPVDESLHAMVRKIAIAHPDNVAVDAWDGRLTYLELVTMAESLAESLRRRGIQHQSVIPCMFDHSRWAVVAALAVLTVGGICMNLEPSHPRARHEQLLELTQPYAIFCSATFAKKAQGLAPCVITVSAETAIGSSTLPEKTDDNNGSEQDAYIMFTSGSTGTPKGVVLQHRALATSLTSFGQRCGWRRGLRVLQFAAYVWDASIAETFITLIFGGCVCIPSGESRESGLADYINATGVELIIQTPSGMRNLSPEEIPTVKTLVSGGERVPPEAAETWGSQLRLINAWGPCEASIAATFADLVPESKYPETIGKACGSAVWITDPMNPSRLVPIGAVGELIIEGAAVARGYFSNDVATAAAFIDPPPWAPRRSSGLTKSRRFYRTGDLAKYNDDGSICFLGRRDHQIKIRGQRLELGEIESAIAQCSQVRAVAVVAPLQRGYPELAAVLTLLDPQLPRELVLEEHLDEHRDIVARHATSVRSAATTKLPAYMAPTQWLVVQELPRAVSNKIDRKAIEDWLQIKKPTPSSAPNDSDRQPQSIAPPESAAEKTLQAVWSAILNVPENKIGRESSFLRLGGDSITAMQVATRCRRVGLQLSVQALMQHPTLGQTAIECKNISTSMPKSKASYTREPSTACLSPIQHFLTQNNGPAADNHFNQSWLLQLNTSASAHAIEKALQRIVDMHAMLRARFSQEGPTYVWKQSTLTTPTPGSWRFLEHVTCSSAETQQILNATQSSFNILEGPVFSADLINNDRKPDQSLLFLAAHHLVCDIISWRVILEDFETLLTNPDDLIDPTTPYLSWVESEQQEFATRASSRAMPTPSADLDYWNVRDIPLRVVDTVREQFVLGKKVTELLMGDACNKPFNTRPAELMLTAVLSAFQKVFSDREAPAAYCEGHGRGTGNCSFDVSRTVGWFTTMYPVSVEMHHRYAPDQAVIATKDAYRSALQNETWFREQQRSGAPLKRTDLELLFNYAGHLSQANSRDKVLSWGSPEECGVRLQNVADHVEQVGLLSVFSYIKDHKLHFWIDYNKKMAHQARIQQWIGVTESVLCQYADELPTHAPRLTRSDLNSLNSAGDLDTDRINQRLGELDIPGSNVESLYPCSAVQEGILFAQLKGQGDEYRDRFAFQITAAKLNDTVSVQGLENAWRSVCQANPILRTVFADDMDHATAFQQVVLCEAEPTVKQKVLDGNVDISTFLQAYPKAFTPEMTPPHCLTVVQSAIDYSTYVILDMSHAIADARTMHIIAEQLTFAYQSSSQIPRGPEFSDYITWVQAQRDVSRQYWISHLSNQKPCLLPATCVPTEGQPASLQVPVPYSNATEINSFCQQHGVTVASFAQAIWALVLKRYSTGGTTSPCFGCMHSGRDAIENAENIMGPLVAMLISRFDTSSRSITFLDLLNQARRDTAEGSNKVGCSLGEIHESLGLGTTLLFNTIMSIQPAWSSQLGTKDGAIAMEPVHAEDPTEYPITVAVAYSKEKFSVQLSCKPEVISTAFAEQLAKYFATITEALLASPEQSLATMSLLQDTPQTPIQLDAVKQKPQAAPTRADGAKEQSQYWTDHLSRVQRVSAFPSKAASQRVLKDSCRKIHTTIAVPEDQSWISSVVQASWALCLARLTGNHQVLFGLTVNIPPESKNGPVRNDIAIVPYAVQLEESATARSLADDARHWALDSRSLIDEGRNYVRRSRGDFEPFGQLNNVLSIHTDEPGSDGACQSQLDGQRLLPANSRIDDWGCGLTIRCNTASEAVISIEATYDSLLMDAARADLILRQYEHCIIQMIQTFDTNVLLTSLDAISNEERSIMRQWSSKPVSTADVCIHDEITQRATAMPNSAAVNAYDGEISFAELDDLSSRLSAHLIEAGVRTGTFVPLFFEKSCAAVVAILAVMKAGGAFVPMDIKHPKKRRAVILAELDSPIALISSSWRDKLDDLGSLAKNVVGTDIDHLRNLPARLSKGPAAAVGLNDTCYIIYTSGSTGKPKGIVVDHSNIAISARSFRNRLDMTQRTRTLQYVSFTFDPSLCDIFMTLLSGGCVFMPTEEECSDATGIVKAINRTSSNWLFLTPSLATLLEPEDVPTVETLVLLGEAMRTDVVEAWADRVALVNAYGPSEGSIEASCRLIRHGTLDPTNLGTPNDCLFWIVDENNHDKLVPIGSPGELILQGPNVARGYLHNPGKTKAAFIDQPVWMKNDFGAPSSHRLYKTGDIVQQHVDGSVTYLGRNDSQFKLRGQRVDVNEIEHHLRDNLGHEWQVIVDVVHWPQDSRDPSLVCFLAQRPGNVKAADASALLEPRLKLATNMKAALASMLPVYMIPDFYLPLRGLPSASSGKTDRNALRSIASSIAPRELVRYTADAKPDSHVSSTTKQGTSQASQPGSKFVALQKAWSHVLSIPSQSIDRNDHWFSIGGNSVKAMRLVAAARKEGLKLTVVDVFNNPVLADLELVASFETKEKSSRQQLLLQTRNQDLFTRIHAHIPFLIPGSIESAAVATDAQAWMLAVGEAAGSGFQNEVCIDSKDGLDVALLTKACTEVTRHHPLLRTIFVPLEDTLCQVVLYDPQSFAKRKDAFPGHSNLQEVNAIKHVPCFFYEKFSPNGRLCHRLRLTIHHALYDAMFLQIVLADLASAYCGRPLTTSLAFHDWIAQINAKDFTTTQAFWKGLLHDSTMTSLQPPNGPCRHETQSGVVRMRVPIERLHSSAGTEASVLKAAWAIVLARELRTQDIVFGQVSANRSSEFLETDQVLGPCLNFLPVRAFPACNKGFSSLVQEIDAQHRASLPHHDLGFRKIIRNCTDWPSWTRFGSFIVYQNHGSSIQESGGAQLRIGDVECVLSGKGQAADASDVWVIAEPEGQAVSIHLRYIPSVISTEQAERLARNLTTVLQTGVLEPISPAESVSPTDSTWSLCGADQNAEKESRSSSPNSTPSEQAQCLASKAWREVKLFHKGPTPEEDISMFDCGADLVTAFLLSKVFQYYGYDISVAKIVSNPTQRTQALLLDKNEKGRS